MLGWTARQALPTGHPFPYTQTAADCTLGFCLMFVICLQGWWMLMVPAALAIAVLDYMN